MDIFVIFQSQYHIFYLGDLDDKLLIIKANIPDLRPRKLNFGRQLILILINVETEVGDAEPQVRLLLVEDLEVVDAAHVEVLRDL